MQNFTQFALQSLQTLINLNEAYKELLDRKKPFFEFSIQHIYGIGELLTPSHTAADHWLQKSVIWFIKKDNLTKEYFQYQLGSRTDARIVSNDMKSFADDDDKTIKMDESFKFIQAYKERYKQKHGKDVELINCNFCDVEIVHIFGTHIAVRKGNFDIGNNIELLRPIYHSEDIPAVNFVKDAWAIIRAATYASKEITSSTLYEQLSAKYKAQMDDENLFNQRVDLYIRSMGHLLHDICELMNAMVDAIGFQYTNYNLSTRLIEYLKAEKPADVSDEFIQQTEQKIRAHNKKIAQELLQSFAQRKTE